MECKQNGMQDADGIIRAREGDVISDARAHCATDRPLFFEDKKNVCTVPVELRSLNHSTANAMTKLSNFLNLHNVYCDG